ncbi:MAG: glycosyltransferase family 4 protein [Chloroflexota bacterium]|nr:glycosyltransferase family 4 protein [Chloroflexota bacterium]
MIKHSAVGRHGGTRLFYRLAQELIALGVTVDLLVHDHDPEAAFPEMTQGLDVRAVRRVRYAGPRSFAQMLVEQERHSRDLAKLVPDDADVLHVHEWRGLRAGVLAKRGRPLVWSCNDPSPWDTWASSRRLLRRSAGALFSAIDRTYAVSAVDRLLVLSEQAQAIMKASTGAPSLVVRCGVDVVAGPSRRDARRALGVGDGVIALSVGVLVPRRRFEDLIEALALVAGIRAVIIGTDQLDARYARSLRDAAARWNVVDRVAFVTTPPTDAELRLYYAAADMFVFPNEEQTWGLAVTEAMAAGLPCVVSSGAGVHEVLKDGSTALVVPPRSPRCLASAMDSFAADEGLRERIATEALRLVTTQLSWRAFALSVLTSYPVGRNTPTSSGSTTAP